MELSLPYLSNYVDAFQQARQIPRIKIDLIANEAQDNPYYHNIVRQFYRDARRLHRKFPLVRNLQWGVALCRLPESFEKYFMMVEGAARRNYKKARRLGYEFRPLDYNNHLDEVTAIWRSTHVRQGEMPKDFLTQRAKPHTNPPSPSTTHDYPYFGIFNADGELRAYASCLVSGELCMIEHIYGHAKYQSDGCVPMLIISMCEFMYEHHPQVKYYGYGTYFGASKTMKRFKRKFALTPHKVTWVL